MYNDWRDLHGRVLKDFIIYLNRMCSNYILKGGTSLMLCYGLNRFSEDIDLDALHTTKGIEGIVNNFCQQNGFTYRMAKNTATVKRCFIHYSQDSKPLKIEISYRRNQIAAEEYTRSNNGILVYTIQRLLALKLSAYANRDKIRDLFDVVFICKNYWDLIPQALRIQAADAFEYKGIEHFDYLIKTQADELINTDVLCSDFLTVYSMLGLL